LRDLFRVLCDKNREDDKTLEKSKREPAQSYRFAGRVFYRPGLDGEHQKTLYVFIRMLDKITTLRYLINYSRRLKSSNIREKTAAYKNFVYKRSNS